MTPETSTPAITEAVQLFREGKQQESRDCLQRIILKESSQIEALLWLARVTPDPQEAIAAAELAHRLDPDNEIAQRAVIEVRKREEELPGLAAEQEGRSAPVTLSTGMPLAQARMVPWPFRGVNRPMGKALEEGTISLRDLAYAVERARDSRVQEAAKTLLLAHLTGAEPLEPPPPLKVVAGSRYVEEEERHATIRLGMAAGVGMALTIEAVVIAIIAGILDLLRAIETPTWLWLTPFVALGFGWISTIFLDRFKDRADQFRVGRRGEDRVVDELRYHLDGRWTLFRNFELPYRDWGDIDLVLVGPGGVRVFEVKAYSGQNRNIGDRWERKDGWRWRKLTAHPGHQARRNAARLRDYLSERGVSLKWVEAVVVWAGEPNSLGVQDPATPVWSLDELSDHVEEIWQSQTLPESVVQRVVEVLEEAVHALHAREAGARVSSDS